MLVMKPEGGRKLPSDAGDPTSWNVYAPQTDYRGNTSGGEAGVTGPNSPARQRIRFQWIQRQWEKIRRKEGD